jgi:hypothetical protein
MLDFVTSNADVTVVAEIQTVTPQLSYYAVTFGQVSGFTEIQIHSDVSVELLATLG